MIGEEATILQEAGKGMKDGERVANFQKNLDIPLQIAAMVMETGIGEDITIIVTCGRGMMIDRLLPVDQHRLQDQEIFLDQSRQDLPVEYLPNPGDPYSHQLPSAVVPLAEQAVVAIVPTIVPLHDLVLLYR